MKTRRSYLACVLSLALWTTALPAAAQTAVDEGQKAYEAGNYALALQKWQPLSDQGNPTATYLLAVMYAQGKGVPLDKAKAVKLYTTAADKNFTPAQYNLGMIFATGDGVSQNFRQAEYWWNKAAEAGLMQAQFNLGNLYYFGIDGVKDPELARKWLTRATQQGSPYARQNLARLDAEFPPKAAPAPKISPAETRPAAPADDQSQEKEAAAPAAALPAPTASTRQISPPDTMVSGDTPAVEAPPAAAKTVSPPSTPAMSATAAAPPAAMVAAAPAAATAVPNARETSRREAWLMAQPPRNFTIQILSVGSEAAVRDFIKTHDLGAGAAFVESDVKGAAVFRLLYGSYATRDLAQKALATVPKANPTDAPWIRSMAELQKQLDPRYLKR